MHNERVIYMKKSIPVIYTIFLIMMIASSCNRKTIKLFTGRFTEAGEKGFYLFDFNRTEEGLNLVSESDAGPNPSYFCIAKKNRLIYVANEVMEFKGLRGGGVTTLKYDVNTGGIEKINELTVPDGGPCYISLSPDNNFLFMANYSGGSVTVVRLDNKGIPDRVTDTILYAGEEGKVSHPHMISSDPAGKRVYVTDLGLDRIVIYYFDPSSGQLQQIQNGIVKLTKGAGPRHFVFSSDGSKMYVINELNSTISVFDVNSKGELKSIQTLTTLRAGFKGESFCADIHMGKNGEFIYGSNRGENSIVTFRVRSDGTLILAGHTSCGGNWPRNFVIDPSGKYLLVGNQRSGNISLFRIDKMTGIPIEPGKDYKINAPACLKFSDIK
jgi:6-phosphogluconolactonase